MHKEFSIDIGRLNNFSYTDGTRNEREFMFSSLKRTWKIQHHKIKVTFNIRASYFSSFSHPVWGRSTERVYSIDIRSNLYLSKVIDQFHAEQLEQQS